MQYEPDFEAGIRCDYLNGNLSIFFCFTKSFFYPAVFCIIAVGIYQTESPVTLCIKLDSSFVVDFAFEFSHYSLRVGVTFLNKLNAISRSFERLKVQGFGFVNISFSRNINYRSRLSMSGIPFLSFVPCFFSLHQLVPAVDFRNRIEAS